MRVLESRFGVVCGYLATVCGLFLLAGHLSSHVARQAAVVLIEHLPAPAPVPRPLSRVEQQIEISESFSRTLEDEGSKVVVLTAPALTAGRLAAALDLAEAADIRAVKAPARRGRVASRRAPHTPSLSAGEIFGRRFGVLTVASR